MVAGIVSIEVESPVEAKRLWNALVKDQDLVPREMPEICEGVTLLEGNGGVGSIKQINFTPANKYYSYVKERVDVVDEGNFVYSYSHVEGGELGKKLSSVKFTVKLSPKAGGGCNVSHSCEYDTLPGISHDEEQIEEMKAQSTAFFKKLEAYIISNPALYNE